MVDLEELKTRLRRQQVQGGLLNCHVRGLHSLVVEQRPDGSLLRIFYTDAYNRLSMLFNSRGHFTLGAHNHNKSVEFQTLYGTVWNVYLQPLDDFIPGALVFQRYDFRSALATGREFRLGRPRPQIGALLVTPLDQVRMEPQEVHTVLTSGAALCAWVVDEGPTVPEFQKHIYSPRNDLTLTREGLYVEMRPDQITWTCEHLLLQIRNHERETQAEVMGQPIYEGNNAAMEA